MEKYLEYKEKFDSLMGVKPTPDEHEKILLSRAEKYIQKLTWIPGLRMVAVVNSLSMYATDKDSDIDLFIITSRRTLFFVRVMVTLTFWMHSVWRHGEDVAGNFCLSFFITEDAMDIHKVSIDDDIYLYFWCYYMKPIFVVGDIWERFKIANNQHYLFQRRETPLYQDKKSPGETIAKILDIFITPLLIWRSRRTYEKKGRPEGVIISRHILKFHDTDRRKEIRDTLQKNRGR